ncbi:unnamed protein product [Prorocentrum cordatum]|uniref:Small ribosomal subunit protein uS7 domain-containing protein n=1 Tax=Prorocentrum cordatum TaxID=2364126 RepID=A0ABN9WM38_9DINO|nr:unnamed protein product [Polarella glacialis]
MAAVAGRIRRSVSLGGLGIAASERRGPAPSHAAGCGGGLAPGARVCVLPGRQFHEFGAGDRGVVARVDAEAGTCQVEFDGRRGAGLAVSMRHLRLESAAPPASPPGSPLGRRAAEPAPAERLWGCGSESASPRRAPEAQGETTVEVCALRAVARLHGGPQSTLRWVKLFGRWAYEDVNVSDLSLVDYIAVKAGAHTYLPHTQGRYQAKRFRKALCPIVERLCCSMMMHGRNNGKKLMAVRIVKHAFEIIHLLTDKNPIQVYVDAVKNGGPREDSTRVGSAGVVRRQAVDVSPLRRVNQAIYLICTGARNSAFRNIKSIAEALADEIMNAAKESSNSYAIKKKDEIERVEVNELRALVFREHARSSMDLSSLEDRVMRKAPAAVEETTAAPPSASASTRCWRSSARGSGRRRLPERARRRAGGGGLRPRPPPRPRRRDRSRARHQGGRGWRTSMTSSRRSTRGRRRTGGRCLRRAERWLPSWRPRASSNLRSRSSAASSTSG